MARPERRRAAGTKGAAEECARRILEVVPRGMRVLRQEMRREVGSRLSVPQFRALAFLGRTPGASLSAVAEFMGVAAATASAMVERLVRRRLVMRKGDPHERRRVMLALTPRGATLLDRAHAHARARVVERLAGFTASDLVALAQGLASLARVLDPAANPEERP